MTLFENKPLITHLTKRFCKEKDYDLVFLALLYAWLYR